MGAWGTAIFSNDLSSDLREEFRDLVAGGLGAEAATEALATEYAMKPPPLADPDEAADFWLGLALTQHRLGRLLPEVHRAAVAAATDPRELERWPLSDRKKRASSLTKAMATLAEPQRPPRKLRPRTLCTTELQVGQHVLYRLDSGRRVMFRVLDLHEDKGGRGPVVALLDWRDTAAIPKKPGALRVQDDVHPGGQSDGMGFLLFGRPGDPSDRLEFVTPETSTRLGRLRARRMPGTSRRISQWVSRWEDLDRWFDGEGNVRWPTTTQDKPSRG